MEREVPLYELLEDVPENAKLVIDSEDGLSTRYIPIGNLCKKATKALTRPKWVCCVCGEPEALGIVHSANAPCFYYTKREWVGLTDEEINLIYAQPQTHAGQYAKAIEAKLKEKNT